MKRWIHSSVDLFDDNVFLEDTIELTIDVHLDSIIEGSKDYNLRFDKWTTVDDFRKEVVELLIKKYKFNVMTETINGKQQKGWTTNRNGSPSIYINSFYNLANAKKIAKELGLPLGQLQGATSVKCFIHLSVSDHTHYDDGDVAHQNFIEDNANSHTARVNDIAMYLPDEHIKISEQIYQDYKAGFIELEAELRLHIQNWIVKYNQIHKIRSE